jgi:hypothetical protein
LRTDSQFVLKALVSLAHASEKGAKTSGPHNHADGLSVKMLKTLSGTAITAHSPEPFGGAVSGEAPPRLNGAVDAFAAGQRRSRGGTFGDD